jgi:hypothetical protein
MPAIQTDIAAAAARVQATATISIDRVRLKAVGLHCTTANIAPTDIWAEIGIMNGSNQPVNISIPIAAGYLGTDNAIGETCDILGDSSQWLFVNVWSNAAATLRLTALTEKV